MKKIGLLLLTAFAVLPLLQSCNEKGENILGIMATVQPLSNGDYYFKLDNGKTAYPGDKSRVGNYEASEGQRVSVYYRLQDKIAEGYDYNFKLYEIQEILTKGPVTVRTQTELDAMGDDMIDLIDAHISGGYLDIYYRIVTAEHSKHELNLIRNLVQGATTDEDGYTLVEFRHNAHETASGYYYYNTVSFRLGDIDPAVTGSKGLCVRVKPITYDTEEIVYKKYKPISYGK